MEAGAPSATRSALTAALSLGRSSPAALYSLGRSSPSALYRGLQYMLTPRSSSAEERALQLVQRCARNWLLRHEQRKRRLLECYALMFVRRERRAAMLVQRRWRFAVAMRPLRQPGRERDLLVKVQAATRGHRARDDKWRRQRAAELAREHAARVVQGAARRWGNVRRLRAECCGILAKRSGRKYGWGKWEAFLWQERHVCVDAAGLVCRHVSKAGAATGPTRELPFERMRAVRAAEGGVLVVECEGRSCYFACGSRRESELWAVNLVALAEAAGHAVPGFMVEHERVDLRV